MVEKSSTATLEDQALSHMKAGKHLEAAELLKKVEPSELTAARVNGTIALCYFRANAFAEAISYFQRSLQHEKDFGRLIQLGQACLFAKRFNDAVDAFAEGAKWRDDPVRAQVWLARTFMDAGDLQQAREIIYEISDHLSWNLPRTNQIPFSHYPYFLQWVPEWRKHLAGTEIEHVLEIGSMEGLSSIWIADQLLSDAGLLYCNDLKFRPEFRSNLDAAALKNPPILIEGSSEFALVNLKNASFDFVYVDGDHRPEAVFQDGVNAIRCTRAGGVVAFDDYLNRRNNTQCAVDILLDLVGASGDVMDRGRQVLFRRRSSTVCDLEIVTDDRSISVDWRLWKEEDLSKFHSEDLLQYLSRKGREVFRRCVTLN